MIRLFILFFVGSFFSSLVVAQETNESYWLLNFDSAKTIAQVENKHILIAFTGSDWCTNCIKLEKEILNQETFLAFAVKNLVMVRADFPRRKKNLLPEIQTKHNEQLAASYNSAGQFPTVALVTKNGKLINTTGYLPINPGQYVEHIKSLLK